VYQFVASTGWASFKQASCQVMIEESVSVPDLPSTLKTLLREFRLSGDLEVHERIDLGAWTTLGTGGLGNLLIRCSTASAAQRAIDLLASHGLRWLVLGAGSRIVVPDAGLRIPLLHLTGDLHRWHVDPDGVVVGGGAKLAQMGGSLARAGVEELESLVAEPGTVGGDLRAAAAGEPSVLVGRLEWLELARPGGGEPRRVTPHDGLDGSWGLRDGRSVAVRARFRVDPTAASGGGVRVLAGQRPMGPLRGRVAPVVFYDPAAGSAAELLRRAGCTGLRVGGAQVPEWSANAIVATAVCTAHDVAELQRQLRDRVAKHTGVTLTSRLWFVDELGSRIGS
jgi:UDP-N-acetylmuramate dehydrogenase